MFTDTAFDLLAGLADNNPKDWFDPRRDAIKAELEALFALTLEAISDRLRGGPAPLRGGKATMLRMNRDVRFSKDKAPYNAPVSGVLTRSGTKDQTNGLVYLHLDAGGGFAATGFYRLPPAALGPLRDAIVADPKAFRRVLDDLGQAGLALLDEDSLTAMPSGYGPHAEAWFAPHLRRTSFMVQAALSHADWTGGTVVERVATLAEGAAPLLKFGVDAA
jgi:uncharacterized protein (TIGR02453 family)